MLETSKMFWKYLYFLWMFDRKRIERFPKSQFFHFLFHENFFKKLFINYKNLTFNLFIFLKNLFSVHGFWGTYKILNVKINAIENSLRKIYKWFSNIINGENEKFTHFMKIFPTMDPFYQFFAWIMCFLWFYCIFWY